MKVCREELGGIGFQDRLNIQLNELFNEELEDVENVLEREVHWGEGDCIFLLPSVKSKSTFKKNKIGNDIGK